MHTLNKALSSSNSPDTLPAHLCEQARLQPRTVALRFKRLGIWHEKRWPDLLAEVAGAAAALQTDGFGNGDVLALLGQPSPEAVVMLLAAQWLGGVVAPLALDAEPEALASALIGLRPCIAFGDDQEQVDRLLAAGFSGKRLIYADARGLHAYRQTVLASYGEWLAAAPDGSAYPHCVARDVALRYHVAGGWDDGPVCRITHAEILDGARRLIAASGLNVGEEAFAGRRFAPAGVVRYLLAPWLLAGFTLNIAESPESRDPDRREIGPSLILGSAETYARLRSRIQARLPASRDGWRGRLVSAALHSRSGLLARILVRRPLAEVAGLGRVRHALVVGPAPDADLTEFFARLGVSLRRWPDAACLPQNRPPEHDLASLLNVWVAP
ncbi:AMP-binding protein [Zoogloea sp.]|uniref:AMP-binding protein n=1 Tax=Zoogloea sp. TaxID=49181 RepID=UPI0014157B34|nr:MAG: long-chain fatty acid--CoA ligase [Zoogloea sp.]